MAIITRDNLLKKKKKRFFFSDFLWVKDVCDFKNKNNFLAVTFSKHCIPEPIRFMDILRVRWFLVYRKYAITGRLQTTTFLKGGASPPALDDHAATTAEL